MTGNFKIIMVYKDGKNPKRGWLVHTKNCEEKYFYNFVTCAPTSGLTRMPKKLLVELFTPHKEQQESKTDWMLDDMRRKLDFDEYMALGNKLKDFGFRYNKKTDKLIII